MFDKIQPAGRTSVTTDYDDQSEISEEGYIMDLNLVGKLIDNFDAPRRKKDLVAPFDIHRNDFYASIKLEHMTMQKVRKLPTILDLVNLGMYCLVFSYEIH